LSLEVADLLAKQLYVNRV